MVVGLVLGVVFVLEKETARRKPNGSVGGDGGSN